MAENGWGGEGASSPPLYASAEAPRAPGMAETFRSWPLWARVAAPMAVAFVALVLVGSAVAAVAGEPEESDGTETAATQPPTTADRTTTTTRPPTTTTTAPTTTAPPTTTTTAPSPTTAPPAPAAPLPPPTTAAPPATVAPAPAEPACHPSYSGCVPMASDVDCAGGSGDGPEYTGTVTVIGTDEYDLDSDNDGVACEP